MAKLDGFDAFAGATSPVSDQAAKPEPPPPAHAEAPESHAEASGRAGAANGSGNRSNGRQKASGTPREGKVAAGRTAVKVEAVQYTPEYGPPPLTPREEKRWLHWLGASAGKLAKSREQVQKDERDWYGTVNEAREAGVDENMILAAAFRARIEVPAPEE